MKISLASILALTSIQLFAENRVVSDADEIRIGHLLAEKLVTAWGLRASPQTVKIERYLQSIGDRVATNAPRHLHYRFRFDPEPGFKSAFALPGGEIFVGGGILAFLDSEDQLAAVLGHEIEHVALGQCRERLQALLTERKLTPASAASLKVESFFKGYGHDGELAADREGIKLAAAAGYSPKAAIRLLDLFLFISNQSVRAPNDATTILRERIAQIHAVVEESRISVPTSERPLALP